MRAIERIVVKLMVDPTGYAAGIGIATGLTTAFAMSATRAVEGMVRSVTGLLQSQAAAVLKAGTEWERYGTAFEVMTGSAAKGRAMLESVEALAIRTPYTFNTLVEQAQKLMGMGVGENQVVMALSKLGDLAVGDAEKLKRLALAYGQVMAAGRFMGTELRQFTEAGVGVADFAKTAGMAPMEFRAMMQAGMIGPANVTETINRLTSEGGRFYGMNERQNRTVLGQWNALNETIDKFRRRVGTAFLELFDVAREMGSLTKSLEAMFDEGAIRSWMENAAKAVGPIIEALKITAGTGVQTLSDIFGPGPNWKDIQEGMTEFSFEATVAFAELADAVEAASLKLGIFTDKVNKVFNLEVAAGVAGPVDPGLMEDLLLGGPKLLGMGDLFKGESADPRQKQVEAIEGRNRRVEMKQSWEDRKWLREQLDMGPNMMTVRDERISVPISLDPEVMATAIRIKKELQEGANAWDKFAVTLDRIEHAQFGFFGKGGIPPAHAALGGFGAAGVQAMTEGAIGDREALFGRYQAFLELEKAMGAGQEHKLPAAVLRGSGEASAIINATSGTKTMQDRMLAVNEAIKDHSEVMEKEMRDFNTNIKNLPVLAIVKKGKK